MRIEYNKLEYANGESPFAFILIISRMENDYGKKRY